MDGALMEPSRRNQWQPVANVRDPKTAQNKPIRNRWQPTATVPERMVRRGSTVRVRQRALQKRRKAALSRMCSVVRGPSEDADGAVYGAFASRTPVMRSGLLGARGPAG